MKLIINYYNIVLECEYSFSFYFNKFNLSLTHLVGDQKAPPRSSVDAEKSPLLPMTLMESSAATLHESLKVVIDYQTHHRLRESSGILYLCTELHSIFCLYWFNTVYSWHMLCICSFTLDCAGRSFAEDLNDRVQWWSLGQTTVIILVGIGQVLVLRSFFTDRRHGVPTRVFKRWVWSSLAFRSSIRVSIRSSVCTLYSTLVALMPKSYTLLPHSSLWIYSISFPGEFSIVICIRNFSLILRLNECELD